MSHSLLLHDRLSWTMTTNSQLVKIGAPAVGGLLLIVFLAPWNYLQMTEENNDSVPSIPVEESPEATDAATESSESVSEVNDSDGMDTDLNQPMPENDSPPVSPVIEIPTNNDVADNVVSEQQDSSSSSVTYVSGGGHGHRSSHSSNSNSDNSAEDDAADQSDSGSGAGSGNQNQEPDDGIDEDNSFFVLPESPIGSVLILASSLASMGGYLAYRARRLG